MYALSFVLAVGVAVWLSPSMGMRGAAIAEAVTLTSSAVARLLLVHHFVKIWPFDRPFAQLPGDRQSHLLEQLEKDEIALPSLSSKFFFDLLWRNTEEGYFADPLYGGNRNKVGWKLLGFPGVPSGEYRHLVTSTEPYHAEPVSVLDVQTGKVPLDAEGFPKHIIIKRNSNKES